MTLSTYNAAHTIKQDTKLMNQDVDEAAKDFAKRLNEALDLRSYPSFGRGRVNYVQEVFNISRSGANKWLHGKAIPHRRKREEIAEKLNVSLKWLETGHGEIEDIHAPRFETTLPARNIPIISMSQAYNIEEAMNDSANETIVISNQALHHGVAIRNVGNAMSPRFQEQSILIVDLKSEIADGDYVIVKTSGFPEALFRQYIKGASGDYLVALNTKFEPIRINDSCEIVGKVIEVRSQL